MLDVGGGEGLDCILQGCETGYYLGGVLVGLYFAIKIFCDNGNMQGDFVQCSAVLCWGCRGGGGGGGFVIVGVCWTRRVVEDKQWATRRGMRMELG